MMDAITAAGSTCMVVEELEDEESGLPRGHGDGPFARMWPLPRGQAHGDGPWGRIWAASGRTGAVKGSKRL